MEALPTKEDLNLHIDIIENEEYKNQKFKYNIYFSIV